MAAENKNIFSKEAINKILSIIKTGLSGKVDKEDGKGLSTNDFNNTYKNQVDTNKKDVAALKTVGAEKNTIQSISVNGTAQSPSSARNVDLTVPTAKDIEDAVTGKGYQTAADVKSTVEGYGYQTASQVNTIVTGKGYQSASQVKTAIEGYNYQTAAQVQAALNEALGGITGIDFQVVTALPDTGKKGVIYLITHSHGSGDNYDEYIWIESSKSYEKIGNTDIDLSAYAKTADFTEVTASDIETMYEAITV